MALRALVRRNIDLAFRVIGDLAVDATLVPSNAGTYTFGDATGISGATALDPITVRGVIQTVEREEQNDEQSNGTQVLFPAHRLPSSFNRYTTITFAGDDVPWDVVSWNSDGHITTADIRRTIV